MFRTIMGRGVRRVGAAANADYPLLVVSPHLDDVVLSCFALVARPEQMTVLHACTSAPDPAVSTEWDALCGFADSDEADAKRKDEERAAFAGTPHQFREVGLLDGQYLDGYRPEAQLQAISDAVTAWIDDVGTPCTVAMPIGAGRSDAALAPRARLFAKATRWSIFFAHADHLATRDATLAAAANRDGVEVLFYEDYPYLVSQRGTSAAREMTTRLGIGAALEAVDVAVDRVEKARRLQAYVSQLPALFPSWAMNKDRLHWLLPRNERFWRPLR